MRITRDCWKCEHLDCGHEWIAKGEDPPEQCGKCKRRRWHTETSAKPGKKQKSKRQVAEEAVAAIEETVMPASELLPRKDRAACPTCGKPLLDWTTSWRCVHCAKNFPK